MNSIPFLCRTNTTMPPSNNKQSSFSIAREFLAVLALLGSWVWFFSAQASDIKINTKAITDLTALVYKVSDTVTDQRIKHSYFDEHMKSIERSLEDIKITLKNK